MDIIPVEIITEIVKYNLQLYARLAVTCKQWSTHFRNNLDMRQYKEIMMESRYYDKTGYRYNLIKLYIKS